MLRQSNSLRRLLLVDAAISGATGILLMAGAGGLHALFGVPPALIRSAGLVLLPFAAMVLYFARSEALSSGRVWTVIVMNVAWVAASFVVLVSGWIDPTALGMAFVVLQALAVAVLAEVQYTTMRRALVA
jgi:hypothetical protein